MANKVDQDIYKASMYKDQFDKSSKDELSFFDTLETSINDKIKSNRHITLNNINAIQSSLSEIREKASHLTDSIIQHEDNMIIKKQEIIDEALDKIHHQLFDIYQYESHQIDDRVYSIENLHNELVDSNLEYFTTYKFFLSGLIENIDTHHHFLKQKSESINYTIDKHFDEINQEFKILNEQITRIDDEIKKLMTIKTHKEDILDEFFDIEIRNLTDQQINFNMNEDPYSDEIKALTQKNESQFLQFKKHLHYQEDRLVDLFKSEIEDQYDLFYHENYHKTYQQETAEKYAKKRIKPLIEEKKAILHDYKKENLKSIDELNKSLTLYQKLYKTDPFLAQIFFDDGSKHISDQVDFARLYKMNKALKYHIYFTYKLAQLNHEINLYEHRFVHFLESKFISQEIDMVNILKDVKSFLLENSSSIDASRLALQRDKYFIIYLSQLIDAKIDHQIEKENLNRKFLSEFTRIFGQDVHHQADVDIQLLNQSSHIRLSLKESEIDTIHFKHLYENEKRLLLMQQNRIQSETEINYELITSTYLNQMRFAKEQIKLAEEEFKFRLIVIAHNIDSERIHYYEMINHEAKLKDDDIKSLFSHYQKQVYDLIDQSEKTDDSHVRNKIEKQLDIVRNDYRKVIDDILLTFKNNKNIQIYKKRLDELDMYLEDAYIAASKIRDKTIEDMDETYRYAKDKYDNFVETVDKEGYPLDDFLYDSLQESKKRLNEKMVYASMILEDKVGEEIETYKQLYFKFKTSFDSKPLVLMLNDFEDQRSVLEEKYHDKLDDLNQDYQLTIANFNARIREIQSHYETLINTNTKEKNTIIQQKTNLINDKDLIFNDFIKQIMKQHKQELNLIVTNYLNDVQMNQQMNDEVNKDFDNLIESYKPYINYSKKSRNVKRLIKQTIRHKNKAHRKHLRQLKKEIKQLKLK